MFIPRLPTTLYYIIKTFSQNITMDSVLRATTLRRNHDQYCCRTSSSSSSSSSRQIVRTRITDYQDGVYYFAWHATTTISSHSCPDFLCLLFSCVLFSSIHGRHVAGWRMAPGCRLCKLVVRAPQCQNYIFTTSKNKINCCGVSK